MIIVELLFWICGLLLFWTYFGYPAFMYLRAKLLPQKVQKVEGHLPSVTLLICAYNEQDVIGSKLDNTIRIDYPGLEVLVVNDGSDDKTREIVEQYTGKGITLVNQPQRSGKMTAVNTGFALAKGDIVVLSDASPDYAPDALRHLVASFADASVGVVVGTLAIWDRATSVAKPAGLYWRYEAALRRWESQTGSTVAVHGNMFAMRRSLFRPLTGATVNDEFSLAMETLKQGFRVVYEPKAMSYDDASDTMRDEFKRRARINAGRWQALFSAGYLMSAPTWDLRFRLFSHKLLRPLTPLLMIAFAVATFLLAALANTALYTAALIAQGVFYGLAAAGWFAERQGRKIRIFSIPYYFVSSNFAALVGLWRWMRGAQKVTWQKREAK